MLYSEFLNGTNANDNLYTYSEYERINKIYNSSDMDKNQAYAMYQEPSEIIATLLKELEDARTQAREISYDYVKLAKEHEKLTEEHRKEKAARQSLQVTMDEVTNLVHKAYYRLTD